VADDPRHIALVCVDQPNGGRVEFSVGFAGSTPVLAIREFYPDGHRRGAVSTMVRGLDAWLEALLTLRGEAVAALGEGATRPLSAPTWGTWQPPTSGATPQSHGSRASEGRPSRIDSDAPAKADGSQVVRADGRQRAGQANPAPSKKLSDRRHGTALPLQMKVDNEVIESKLTADPASRGR
jgi:hypothetical protein